MFSSWWGRIALVLLIGMYAFGIASSYFGYFVPKVQKDRKHIRQGSHHPTTRHHRHRGFFMGGGYRSGK